MERALIWQISVSQASWRQFQSSRKILRISNSAKVESLVPVWIVQWSVRTPSCVEKILTAQRASVRTSGQYVLDALHCSRRIQISFADTDRERQLATVRTLGQHHPDARATPSGCNLNMKTHEARYGKAVAQFTVRTLYASIQMTPREIRISGDLGLLSL
jgi:hypothetical protein